MILGLLLQTFFLDQA